jgi:pimeloyl-ACP methyl ester carboxylesterase
LSGCLRRLSFAALCGAAVLGAAGVPVTPARAQMDLLPAQDKSTLLGPAKAKGAIIWSHGRSVEIEDSGAPTPDYIAAFRAAGWDTFRLNRLRVVDTLTQSGSALAGEAVAFKAAGYRRVVLAGQSFGAFISLIAAGETAAVDAVIGTAPAAFGNAQSNPNGYGLNATRLYELLAGVRRARVALFFFEGDVFDPGGRGTVADRILAERHLAHLVVDRPAELTSHWAAADAGFTRRFAPCLAAFAGDDAASGRLDCSRLDGQVQMAGLR